MSRPPYHPSFNHPNNISRRIQAMKFIIMQFSPWAVFLPFRSKCLPQHSVLKNRQSMFKYLENVIIFRLICLTVFMQVTLATWSRARIVFDCSNTGIVGSNPVWVTDICKRFSVFCRPLQVQASWWADPPSKEFYQTVYKGSQFHM
jgi:hypothetical protein